MKPYLEDRNGNHLEFGRLPRSKKIELFDGMKDLQDTDNTSERFVIIDELCYKILKAAHPELTKEEFDNILDYNEELYGFNALYELLGDGVNYVFTQEGATLRVHPYLQEKKAKEEPVAEPTPVEQTNNITY